MMVLSLSSTLYVCAHLHSPHVHQAGLRERQESSAITRPAQFPHHAPALTTHSDSHTHTHTHTIHTTHTHTHTNTGGLLYHVGGFLEVW